VAQAGTWKTQVRATEAKAVELLEGNIIKWLINKHFKRTITANGGAGGGSTGGGGAAEPEGGRIKIFTAP